MMTRTFHDYDVIRFDRPILLQPNFEAKMTSL